MAAKRTEISPAKMPLMRIRSVEIVFEDEMSTCTDTGLLDRSVELVVSDSSDDSTKCADGIEPLPPEKDCDSVTLNADGDLSEDDSSSSLNKHEIPEIVIPQPTAPAHATVLVRTENVTSRTDTLAMSPSFSEMADSGRYTEEASSSHIDIVAMSYEDALLSNSFDVINLEELPAATRSYDSDSSLKPETPRLLEYIDSNSDSSDTETCDLDSRTHPLTPLNFILSDDDHTVCDSSDLQYDSFVDMGKF